MSAKSIHIGRSEPHMPQNHALRSSRIRVILLTLFLLGTGYVLWQLLAAEPPLPIPDTPIVPLPAS
jgi:cell division septal protein FtsQ